METTISSDLFGLSSTEHLCRNAVLHPSYDVVMMWWLCHLISRWGVGLNTSDLTQQSGLITHIATDLCRARQKYPCTVWNNRPTTSQGDSVVFCRDALSWCVVLVAAINAPSSVLALAWVLVSSQSPLLFQLLSLFLLSLPSLLLPPFLLLVLLVDYLVWVPPRLDSASVK